MEKRLLFTATMSCGRYVNNFSAPDRLRLSTRRRLMITMGPLWERSSFSGSDLVDIISQSLDGGTAMHEGESGCLIMVYEEQYGNDSNSEKRRLP